ncbi:hypothetical protein DL95DRAFT_385922, partial [Leptodontidium sp. 2 PMI_412]
MSREERPEQTGADQSRPEQSRPCYGQLLSAVSCSLGFLPTPWAGLGWNRRRLA